MKNFEYEYMLLSRLQMDCEYYLGNGERNAKYLWAGNETAQIKKMREIYDLLPVKPEWLTLEQINNYAKRMCVDIGSLEFLGRKYDLSIITDSGLGDGRFSKSLIITTLIGDNGDISSCFVVEHYDCLYHKQVQSYTNFNRAMEHFNIIGK